MNLKTIIAVITASILTINMSGQTKIASENINLKKGDLEIFFIKHASLYFNYNGYIIYIDPVSLYADYSKLPKADLILITHEHSDHYDEKAISNITKSKDSTTIIVNPAVAAKRNNAKDIIMKNGDTKTIKDIKILAVPAYNTTNIQFHPKGRDNGYVLNIQNKVIYVAGDCEDMPELSNLKNIDIAFLPVNQPYTMTPEQAAKAARMFNPKVLYPYHYGNTDIQKLVDLLKNDKNIEVIIHEMQ